MTSSFVDKNGTIPACQHFSMNEKQNKCFNINSYWVLGIYFSSKRSSSFPPAKSWFTQPRVWVAWGLGGGFHGLYLSLSRGEERGGGPETCPPPPSNYLSGQKIKIRSSQIFWIRTTSYNQIQPFSRNINKKKRVFLLFSAFKELNGTRTVIRFPSSVSSHMYLQVGLSRE